MARAGATKSFLRIMNLREEMKEDGIAFLQKIEEMEHQADMMVTQLSKLRILGERYVVASLEGQMNNKLFPDYTEVSVSGGKTRDINNRHVASYNNYIQNEELSGMQDVQLVQNGDKHDISDCGQWEVSTAVTPKDYVQETYNPLQLQVEESSFQNKVLDVENMQNADLIDSEEYKLPASSAEMCIEHDFHAEKVNHYTVESNVHGIESSTLCSNLEKINFNNEEIYNSDTEEKQNISHVLGSEQKRKDSSEYSAVHKDKEVINIESEKKTFNAEKHELKEDVLHSAINSDTLHLDSEKGDNNGTKEDPAVQGSKHVSNTYPQPETGRRDSKAYVKQGGRLNSESRETMFKEKDNSSIEGDKSPLAVQKANSKSKTKVKKRRSVTSLGSSTATDSDDSFFDRKLPLTASSAYKSLIGGASAPTLPKSVQDETSESSSQSEDEAERALALAVKRKKTPKAASFEKFSAKESEPASLPAQSNDKMEKASAKKKVASTEKPHTTRSSISVPPATSRLSESTRKALGLDSDLDDDPAISAKKSPEESSDEFDFYA